MWKSWLTDPCKICDITLLSGVCPEWKYQPHMLFEALDLATSHQDIAKGCGNALKAPGHWQSLGNVRHDSACLSTIMLSQLLQYKVLNIPICRKQVCGAPSRSGGSIGLMSQNFHSNATKAASFLLWVSAVLLQASEAVSVLLGAPSFCRHLTLRKTKLRLQR